jgi:carbamoyl-phosphate synthase small subunit
MDVLNYLKPHDCVLWLEDGSEFKGWSFGSLRRGYGEVVFNTAMSGYQEVLTDTSYWAQIVVMTYPHQGNYGINKDDVESVGGPKVAGFVVHEPCDTPSNFTSEKSLATYLQEHGVPGIYGVDTRALTLKLRQGGVLRGLILSKAERDNHQDVKSAFAGLPGYSDRDLIREVTTKKAYWFSEKGDRTVVAVDYGVKLNLLREIAARGFKIVVVPATSTAEEILAYKPHGVFLSNGPGDPALATYAIQAVKGVLGKKPLFGVCMGHQILGLALGAKTFKMKFGHRGINHPVWDKAANRVEVASQNHGFAVDPATLPPEAVVTHINLNDNTCAGLEVPSLKAFSVQYHPEASPGPHDSGALFDRFAAAVKA